jgi:ATP-binding cassette subfamily B protein
LNEFLHTKSTIQNKEVKQEEKIKGDIEFRNVTFTYPHTGITAIKNFSLKIKQGEKILILGKTGSGKTTIAQLLLHFYEPTTGSITIDDKPLNAYNIHSIRKHITYVPQDVFLFSDTVSANISFGLDDGVEEQVRKAAQQASVENEITQFSHGYETMIGERGVTLSGGQKQRISIARGLIKNPDIVVFDDCLSAVDTTTENYIVNNLSQYLEDKTAIIITHRIFKLLQFDHIIILENGSIAEQGNHEELIEKNGYYAELYRMQMDVAEEV